MKNQNENTTEKKAKKGRAKSASYSLQALRDHIKKLHELECITEEEYIALANIQSEISKRWVAKQY